MTEKLYNEREKYLYGLLPYFEGEWTFYLQRYEALNGSTTTGRHSGYGDITDPQHDKHDLFKSVPVIDLRNDDEALDVYLSAWPKLYPHEVSKENGGTLYLFLSHLVANGVKIHWPDNDPTWLDRLGNQEFVEVNGKEFAAHEGVCLTCYRNTDLVKVEGVESFVTNYPLEKQGRIWDDESVEVTGERGMYEYQCTEGHKTHVWLLQHGDHVAH